MALQVIGSGFGRTGTMSTKQALEQLGFGRCHHMVEVIGDPAQPPLWNSVAAGGPVDWEAVFAGFNAQVDWPGAAVWRETARAFPEAKVIHTERPEEVWWASFEGTIGKFFRRLPTLELPPPVRDLFSFMVPWITETSLGGALDREGAIAAYRRNNAAVRETIPAERLLVFDVAEGWAPLCRFLGRPAPDAPFPRSNHRDEFWAHFGGEPA
jgi:hypothetical protein